MTDVLTQKQERFVTEYISNGFNGYQAALYAGYAPTSAVVASSKLPNHPIIKKRIARAYNKISEELETELSITLADKMKVLARIIYDIIPLDGSEPKRDYYKDALKAMSELSKMQGHYMPDKRVQVTVDGTKERLIEAQKIYEEF